MIQYNPKSWFALIFHAYSRQVFRKLFPAMLAVAALTAGVCYVELELLEEPLEVSNVVHSLLGFVLSLFLVFRTNTAYDRWWEGRKQWGALVNVSRTLAMRVHEFGGGPEVSKFFQSHIPAFVDSLKNHLRPSQPEQPKTPESAPFASAQHAPNSWAQAMEREAARLENAGEWTANQHWLVSQNIERMVDILGACERIFKTPIPYSYSMFMKKFIFLYVVTLPIGFVSTFEWWSIPVVSMVFYILVSVELIAEEIEDPFGVDENDLPLDGLCQTIRTNTDEILTRART